MATVQKEFSTQAQLDAVWDAMRDIGALERRLVPGFVTKTVLEDGARIVTFANGVTVREPIVTIDEARKRIVWTAEGQLTTHYNASLQAMTEENGATRLTWTADFLPDIAEGAITAAMTAGMAAMKHCLNRLAETA